MWGYYNRFLGESQDERIKNLAHPENVGQSYGGREKSSISCFFGGFMAKFGFFVDV